MTNPAHRRRRGRHISLIRGAAAVGVAALSTALLPTAAWAAQSGSTPAAAAVTTASAPQTSAKTDPTLVSAEASATARARATGKPVVVDALTDETSQTVANLDGSLTLTQYAAPVRVRQGSQWAAVNTTLVHRADGTFAPGATDADVAFSGGGNTPLVTMTRDGRQISISWPGTLPVPTVAGDTATYASVLPGVDLAMTARADGFGEVLIVKSAAAAANPALAQLHFGVATKGLTLTESADGTEAAVDAKGATVFKTDTPTMWDSSVAGTPTGTAAPKTAAAAAGSVPTAALASSRSDFRQPGVTAHVAPIAMSFGQGDLTVTPNHALLTDPAGSFPKFIDPAWSGNPSVVSWAGINSNGGKWTSGTDAPVGLDNWSGCGSWCGSVSRSYFEMNDSGFQGANVTQAYFYPYFTWAADSAAEPTQIWLDPDFPSNLSWSNKPTGSSPSTYVTAATTCVGHGTSGCAAGTVQFTVTSAAQIAAGGGRRDFEVDAADESNELQWKRIDPTKTSWTVTYFRAPYLNSTYGTTPKVTGPGGTFVNTPYVTMQVTGGDTDGENVRSGYEIWNWVNNTNTTAVVGGLFSAYSASGGSYTYTGLGDGTYAWRGVIDSKDGDMWSGWSPWQVFTVDTSKPPTPSVESAQFPAAQFGASYTDSGNFTLTTNGVDNVAGYIFSLDGDLGSTAWSQSSPPPTWSGGAITRAKDYWTPGGVSTVSFTPLTVGPHRLYAKAVDGAGNTSVTEATYLFYAGLTSPSYAYGDQLVNGCSAVNTCNGNTVAVPAAQPTLTGGGEVIVQGACCNIHFADGSQGMLANGAGKVAVGDTVVFSFNLPSTGYWDLGANLTSAADYGQYTLTLDKGASTQDTLVTGYDAYSSTVTTSYHDYGTVKNAAGAAVQLNAGVHTLTLTVTGKNSASTGYQAGIDVLRLAPMSATCTITDLGNCENNTAISDDTNHLAADADGYGESFSSGQLKTAGWTPGASITVNGAPMTLPSYAIGKADNVLSSGQTVDIPGTYPNDGNAVEFLAFGTNGAVTGASGTITYASACNSSITQPFTIDNVPDWTTGSAAQHVIGFADRNNPGGQDATSPQVFAVSVPLTCPGQAVASVSLPVVTNKTLPGLSALHILAMGIRASSYTDSTDAQNWTGTFAAPDDSHLGSLGTQTVRMPVHISISGTSLRIHLSNALGSTPASFDHVTVAQQSSGAVPAATPVDVLFGTDQSVTIPAGGEVVSDPLTFTTTGQETLLVSAHLSAADGDVVGHGSAQTTSWTAAAGTDYAADSTGTPFTTTIGNLDWLSGIDVTSNGATTGSLVLYGDQTVNSDSAGGDGRHHLSDVLAGKLAAANGGTVPYGVLNEGTNSWGASNNLLPALSTSTTNQVPPTATNPADRNILNEANVRTVLISTGMSDILAGGDAGTIENKLSALSEQVRHFYTDDATNYSVNINNGAGLITVYLATIPPNATALTSGQEAVREAVNAWILTKATSGSYANGHADGAIDFAAAVSNTGTDLGTTVAAADLYNGNPDDSYYAALAQQFLTNTVTPPAPTSTVTVVPMVISASGGVRG